MINSEYDFPAVRGVQAGTEYFLTMWPLRLLAMLFPDSDVQELSELDTNRRSAKERVQEITQYVIARRDSCVLPALTASVDSPVRFTPDAQTDAQVSTGRIRFPMSAHLALNDGLQRCAGLTMALQQDSSLANESIAVVLFVDPGLKRSKQFFVDLKRHQRKPARSWLLLHGDRDKLVLVTRRLIQQVPVFAHSTEMVRTTISHRSRKLFTLSAIHHANESLLAGRLDDSFAELLKIASEYWNEVAKCVPDWGSAATGEIAPAELRKSFVHAHGLALAALARVGRALLTDQPKTWKRRLAALKTVDRSRGNVRQWEGRALIGQRISKAASSVVLTGNAIKRHLGLKLTDEEDAVERQFRKQLGT